VDGIEYLPLGVTTIRRIPLSVSKNILGVILVMAGCWPKASVIDASAQFGYDRESIKRSLIV
jgi:hypothetical protein